MVRIEIDGQELEVPQGQMIIEAADNLGIRIPRFCYHKKLSIAANCRMCLVEVANAPKTLPACATPVSEGMKVFTKSTRAIDAQKSVMEFLLINHPLDCPVCDQGGQCELQDVSMDYGQDYSQFTERKRAVKDKNIGPLITTEMTRCIHCTRCVRFGSEIAGQRELGATGRGEFMEIGTYIAQSVDSELSGNIIDLCPVGALTSKPFRFQARAWEMQSQPSLSPHDCLGSNLVFHTLRDKVMRALPRDNEAINEVWLTDRDRFSYEALNHPDRLTQPWIKEAGTWKQVDWATALNVAIEKLQYVLQNQGSEALGALASPNSTVEEFYLLQKLLRAKGCHNIDHRLREGDTRQQTYLGMMPSLGITLPELENQQAIVLIGSDIKKEQPLISHRLRKATLHGHKVVAINPLHIQTNFTLTQELVGSKGDLLQPLREVVKAIWDKLDSIAKKPLSQDIEKTLATVTASKEAHALAEHLCGHDKVSVLLGAYAISHPEASQIYYFSRLLAELLQASWGQITFGANSAGGWIAGAVPHRLPLGQKASRVGLSATQMVEKPRHAYIVLQAELEKDSLQPHKAREALQQAQIIALTAFDSPMLREYADVILPVTPISEMAGTYINAMGDWQHFQAAVKPLGESRPAWKVLRVLGNLWDVEGFSYETIEEIIAEVKPTPMLPTFDDTLLTMSLPQTLATSSGLTRLAPTALYAVDSITRRAAALQQTHDAQMIQVRIHSEEAAQRRLQNAQTVWVKQDGRESVQPLAIEIDDAIPLGAAVVPAGIDATMTLGAPFGAIELIPHEQ